MVSKAIYGVGSRNFRIHNLLVKTTHWWQVHNEDIQVLQEMGVIGLALAGMALTDFFRRLRKDREMIVCSLVVLAGCVNSFLSFPLHLAPLVFSLILGFAFKEVLEKEE